MEGKLWYLKRCDLFVNLTPEQAERLTHNAVMRNFKKRALIYAPTEPGQSVMVVAKGQIKIKDITPEGKETILAFMEPGEVFGELSLIDSEPRSDYAEAITDAQILVLARSALLWLMEQRADLTLSITKLIGLRRRRIENRLRNVLFLSSRERMVRMLCELMQSHGEREGNRCEIRLSLSHQDLASLVGVTRETVTVVLGQLQADRLIKSRRRHLTITDCARLREEATGESQSNQTDRHTPALENFHQL